MIKISISVVIYVCLLSFHLVQVNDVHHNGPLWEQRLTNKAVECQTALSESRKRIAQEASLPYPQAEKLDLLIFPSWWLYTQIEPPALNNYSIIDVLGTTMIDVDAVREIIERGRKPAVLCAQALRKLAHEFYEWTDGSIPILSEVYARRYPTENLILAIGYQSYKGRAAAKMMYSLQLSEVLSR